MYLLDFGICLYQQVSFDDNKFIFFTLNKVIIYWKHVFPMQSQIL